MSVSAANDIDRHPLRVTLCHAWHIGLPFFRSDERWHAGVLACLLIALNLSLVWTTLLFTHWQGVFYDALQTKDWNAFLGSLLWWTLSVNDGFALGFAPILVIFVLATVLELYIRQALQIRMRQWLTTRFLHAWMEDHAYFRMGLVVPAADNPDQRIAEDVRLYVENLLVLGLGAIRSVATIVMFVALLWTLSKPVSVFGLPAQGQLVWFALLYAALGSWIAHLIGRRLTPLHIEQQRAEADFRFSLMRFRGNAEGVAVHRGEDEQASEFTRRFAAISTNWRFIMVATRRLTLFTTTHAQGILVVPFLLVAPAYFSGTLTLGAIFQACNAFAQVQTALSWIVSSYADLTGWLATVDRLTGFERSVATSRQGLHGPVVTFGAGQSLQVSALSLCLPDGRSLLHGANLSIAKGERVLIEGPSGSGKSVFLLAVAGIWPFGAGQIRRGTGHHLFMPQRAFFPAGTLAGGLCYPIKTSAIPDGEMKAALRDVGLDHFQDCLQEEDDWEKRLSGGEVQRLLIARVLLLRPDWLFLDEATSALDAPMEARVHALMLERLPDATIVSVAHSTQVAAFHTRILRLDHGKMYTLVPTSSVNS